MELKKLCLGVSLKKSTGKYNSSINGEAISSLTYYSCT